MMIWAYPDEGGNDMIFYFYQVYVLVACVLGVVVLLHDVDNWLESDRPRKAGDALRELRRDWAPRARAWAEGVLKRDMGH